MLTLYKFVVPAEDLEPETEMGWYYIDATPKQIEEEKESHIVDGHYGDNDCSFESFIAILKTKYNAVEYGVPFHYVINF